MEFANWSVRMRFEAIQKATFKDKMASIRFDDGSKINVICADEIDELEVLKSEILKTVGKERVKIYE